MVTSFKQFTAIHRNEYGRRAVGIELSSAEAQRVAEDPTLARAYYDNWLRSNAPSPPHIDAAMTRADVAAPQSYIEPRHPRTQTRRADSGEAPREFLRTRWGCRSRGSCSQSSGTSSRAHGYRSSGLSAWETEHPCDRCGEGRQAACRLESSLTMGF